MNDWAHAESEPIRLAASAYQRKTLDRPLSLHEFWRGKARNALEREGGAMSRLPELYALLRELWDTSHICPVCDGEMSIGRIFHGYTLDERRAKRNTGGAPSVDCIIPRCRGGRYVRGNVAITHHICNVAKGKGTLKQAGSLIARIRPGQHQVDEDGLLVTQYPEVQTVTTEGRRWVERWAGQQLASLQQRSDKHERKSCSLTKDETAGMLLDLLVDDHSYLDPSGSILPRDVASIDRINPKEGYHLGNVRLLAWFENAGRSNWPDDTCPIEWLEIVRTVV